ncbi:MAG: urea ABC transporter ATP-binding protein UrtD [Planctomycetota bacterium]|nr:MAG: urea ABC transporter ATP-binding protein UrtD [Planctomycetota bacterium]
MSPVYPHYALEVEDLTVSFDGFKAVDNFTMYVEKDELRTVIGPNGAGKTTLLDLICGRTRPSAGKITFMEHDLTYMAEQARVAVGVGRKFQTPSVYPKLTVFENLEVSYPSGRGVWGALFFKRSSEVVDRIHEVAKRIFLIDQLKTPADLLSHGQKQWLEIGMLLISDPALLLLDEPVAGMTVREREQTADLLRDICHGRSTIIIEHDMKFVRKLASKVTVMHQGKLLAEGNIDEIEENPKVIEVYLGH